MIFLSVSYPQTSSKSGGKKEALKPAARFAGFVKQRIESGGAGQRGDFAGRCGMAPAGDFLPFFHQIQDRLVVNPAARRIVDRFSLIVLKIAKEVERVGIVVVKANEMAEAPIPLYTVYADLFIAGCCVFQLDFRCSLKGECGNEPVLGDAA